MQRPRWFRGQTTSQSSETEGLKTGDVCEEETNCHRIIDRTDEGFSYMIALVMEDGQVNQT